MATFPPFKAHILARLDELIEEHRLKPPFLDVGSGAGDVSSHMVERGFHGAALDPSPEAVALTTSRLAGQDKVRVMLGTIETVSNERFRTILLIDVLEHVEDDEGTLCAASRLQERGDCIVLVVPTGPKREWRWDDDLYGHLRRYTFGGLHAILNRAGYEPVESFDLTFPLLWALRRAYTYLLEPRAMAGSPKDRSLSSADAKAWEMGTISNGLAKGLPWSLLLRLQHRLGAPPGAGHELMLLGRRR